MSPELPRRLGRVLGVRLDNIGDVVLLAPALVALKRHTGAEVTLLCSPAGSRAAALVPAIDGVVEARVSWQDISGALAEDPTGDRRLIERLSSAGFDAAIVFTSFSQSAHPPAYACYLAGIPSRAAHSASFAGAVLTHAVSPPAFGMHQAERDLHLLAALGVDVGDTGTGIAVPPEASARARRLLADRGVAGAYALVAPGAGCHARRYPEASFARVVRGLAAEGHRVVVVGSDRERELVANVARAGGQSAVALAGDTSVPEFAAIVERASVAIVNDSAALHLADVLGTPVVVTFSGTDLVSQWAPRFAPAAVLRRETDCSPCYLYECPRRMECLAVPPAEVIAAALRVAASGRSNGHEFAHAEGRSR